MDKVVKTTIEIVNHCNEHSPCKGEYPFKIGKETIWQFIYEDGSIDSGRKVVKYTKYYQNGRKTISFGYFTISKKISNIGD